MLVKSIQNKIHYLKDEYNHKQITGQGCIIQVHQLEPLGLKIGMNIDNYLYRNGILNKSTALFSAKENIKKYRNFPNYQIRFKKELNMIKNSKQQWFSNYGIHDSPLHDLIKSQLDKYKVDGLLSSLLCDLYVGTYNEGSIKPLMLSSNK